MNKKNIDHGIKAMKVENYMSPCEAETALQGTDYSWWSSPVVIVFLTISLSILDALVLYDVMDRAMTQAEYMGKIVAFGISLVLNMQPLLIAKFIHQAIYKIKRHAAVLAVLTIISYFILFSATVSLRFAYQDVYGESSTVHLTNELSLEDDSSESTTVDYKGFCIVLLLSAEPLVTSALNFFLSFISDDELRARINRLKMRRYELTEAESDLQAYIATMEDPEERKELLLILDKEQLETSCNEIHARCERMKAEARFYLAEYLRDPASASYVTSDGGHSSSLTLPSTSSKDTVLNEEALIETVS